MQVAVGYYEMPEKTCEEFQQDEEGGRWFRTGDIGCMMQVTTVRCCYTIFLPQDGTVHIIDRKKDLVKLQGGEYVSLGKVESLLKIHPAIENICVCGDSSQGYVVCLVIPAQTYLDTVAVKVSLRYSLRYLLSPTNCYPFSWRKPTSPGTNCAKIPLSSKTSQN